MKCVSHVLGDLMLHDLNCRTTTSTVIGEGTVLNVYRSYSFDEFINPQRACAARVCVSPHAILAVRAITSKTQGTIVLSVEF